MKIATKIYLITAAAAVLIVADVAVDVDRWAAIETHQTESPRPLALSSRAFHAATEQLGTVAADLRRPPAPNTRGWDELDATGERALALLHHALAEAEAIAPSAAPDDPLPAVLARLRDAAPRLERDWRDFRALTASEEIERVRTQRLLPPIADELLPALNRVEHLLDENRRRLEAQQAAEIADLQNRHWLNALLLLGALGAYLSVIHLQFIRPLRRIERQARALNRGEHLNVSFTYTENDELGAVARAMNDTINMLRSAAFSREELERQVAARTAELRQREHDLEESRAQLRRALDGSQLGTWEWDIAADTVEFSALCVDILGYSAGEIPQTSAAWDNLLHPDDASRAKAATRNHLEGGSPRYELEVRFRARSGEWRWVRSVGRIVERDASGRARRVAGTHADVHIRKIAERNLHRRDEQLRLALAASGSTLWDTDLRDRTVFLDERWAAFVGAPPGDTRTTLRELMFRVPAEERPRVRAAFERVEHGETDEYIVEHRLRRNDGTFVWVRSLGRCTERDHDGRAVRVIGINVDLTAIKASELAAARQAELYAAVNETALDLLARRGTAAVLQGLVDRAATLLDAPSAEVALLEGDLLVPRAWRGAIPDEALKPAGREAVLAWRAVDSRRPAVAQDYRKLPGALPPYVESGTRAAAVFPILDEDGVIGVLGVSRLQPDQPFTPDDVQTGRLLAQLSALALRNATIYEDAVHEAEAKTSALREGEERFHAVFEESPVMMFLLSFPEGKIIEVNSTAEAGFGVRREDMLDRTSVELAAWVDAGERDRYLRLLQQHRHVTGFETRMRRRNGDIFFALFSGSLIEIGGQCYSLNSIQDITAQRLAEARLRQTQKMESLGTLAGGIAHDFNNLLTGILGSAELIRLELPAQHGAQRWLENIASGGARAKRLVQQILAFSRRTEGERGPVDLIRIVEEALRLLGSTLPPMVQIDVNLDRTCPTIRGDPTQLHQVLMNLCTNAWQALPSEGGRIGVRLARTVITAEQQRHNPELSAGPAVVLSVSDDGCGIDPELVPRIFDPFFTTKEAGRGTGLGLAVVHGIVRDHGGAISVQSTPGAGTTLELYFRSLDDPASHPDAPPALPADVPRGHEQRLLFVDDDPGPRAALAGMLQFLGYRVTAVSNPAEALLKFVAQPDGFDLLLADYAMPGMTGLELARQVRQASATLPIVIVSGHLEADQRAESSRLRIAAVLSKPPSLVDLAHTIAGALET